MTRLTVPGYFIKVELAVRDQIAPGAGDGEARQEEERGGIRRHCALRRRMVVRGVFI